MKEAQIVGLHSNLGSHAHQMQLRDTTNALCGDIKLESHTFTVDLWPDPVAYTILQAS